MRCDAGPAGSRPRGRRCRSSGPHLGLLLCKFFYILSTYVTPIDDNYVSTAAGDIQITLENEAEIPGVQPVTWLERFTRIFRIIKVSGHNAASIHQHTANP